MKRKFPIILLTIAIVAGVAVYLAGRRPNQIVLTGIVTTDDVIVSPEIAGRIEKLLINEGDTVTNGQLLAIIQPAEQKAELAYYSGSADQYQAQIAQAQADLNYQELQTSNLVWQSEANLAATDAQIQQAAADLENLTLDFHREEKLYKQGVDSVKEFDQARTAYDAGVARVQSLRKQAIAGQASVALAKSTGAQIPARQATLQAMIHQSTAAAAQKDKAEIVLGYTRLTAPTNATVDVRAAREGEVVNPGQAVVTLINPQNLWVRADVEESFIDSIRLGDKFPVRLPSGETREGTIFFRGIDADFATQRDVSRTKRDIKTFQIRLRCDNHDNALAVGMTAYVVANLRKP